MKDKSLKVKAILDRNLREIVLKVSNDNGIGFISINSVEISNDYSFAKVYVSFLSKDNKKNFEKLAKFAPFIRHELSQKISLYKTPEVILINDDRYIIEDKIEEILKNDDKKNKK